MQYISCSIVLYCNSAQQLKPLVAAILHCSLVYRLYLIDNSPTNELGVLVGSDKIEYIFNNKNLGYGAGHNIALHKAINNNSLYHVVINPDIYFEEGTLETIFDYMQQHPETGQLMPRTVYPNGELQYTCRLLPTPVDLIARRFLPTAFFKKRTQRFEMHNGYNTIMEAPYMLGCFMFLRVSAVKQVGYFDERFFMYPEDIDLTRRMHQQYKTIYLPTVTIVHKHERGSYKSLKLLWVHIVNMVRYFNKWGWFNDKERDEVNSKIEAQFK